MEDGRQEGMAHPCPGLSYREFENKPGLCFNSIHSELLKLCNLQKNQIMSRPLIIEGNLGNNFRKRQILQLCYHLEIAEVVLSLE